MFNALMIRLGRLGTAALFLGVAIALLPLAQFSLGDHDPWQALARMGQGLLRPDFSAISLLGHAAMLTIAFALAGVTIAVSIGFLLAPFYHLWPVRLFSVAIRSVHELFWAILLMQITGLSATTGVLAIALPYAGIFAKVFAEYLEEADPRPARAAPLRADALSRFFYTRLPLAFGEYKTYTMYRLECALRSSAVLGFMGLPTLGFELDSFFKQGLYGAVAAVLILYYVMIATMRWWMIWRLVPLYVVAALGYLGQLVTPPMASGALWRFFTSDIVPAPLRNGDLAELSTWQRLGNWLYMLTFDQAWPGLVATMVVGQLALVVAALVAILAFALIIPAVVGRKMAWAGHIGLVIGRSTPEYMLAYVLLQAFGPSMLPAVLALGLHNGAIIAHLLGRQSEGLTQNLRIDAPRGFALYTWELMPRIWGSFMALCLYRWEIIIRESAIVGLLGVATLGFYIRTAIQEIRIDRALYLLVITMGVTIAIDLISRRIRAAHGLERLRLSRGDQSC